MARLFFFFLLFNLSLPLHAVSISFTSPETRVNLLELYTSEGCSSCPPAERYLNDFVDDERLWKELIPIAFHVDYWNYIGWVDKFSDPKYSQRQREYAKQKNLKTVYTPGFLLNGQEWRSFFGLRKLDLESNTPGKLRIDLNELNAAVSFYNKEATNKNYVANVALLGFDIETRVKAGENNGRLLQHDFIVLSHTKARMQSVTDKNMVKLKLPMPVKNVASMGVVAWISEVDDLSPIQAVGGKLP